MPQSHPLLFELGSPQADDAGGRGHGQARRRRRPDRRTAPRRSSRATRKSSAGRRSIPSRACRSTGRSNPYRGCTHGCHYCFARRYHAQFEMNSDDEFASRHPRQDRTSWTCSRRELDRPSWKREFVAFGTATDPYQPIEGHYKLTRGAIQALTRGTHAVRPDHERTDGGARRGRPARAHATRPGAPST